MKKYISYLLVSCLLCVSCSDNDSASEVITINENIIPVIKHNATYDVLFEADIVYAQGLSHESWNSANSTAIPLKLDVYTPDNDNANRPLFMFIHGGAFEFGSKQQFAIRNIAQYYASRGWVFVSIDYRLKGDFGTVPNEWASFAATLPIEFEGSVNAMYPAQRDAKAALRWLISNKDVYQINTDYITVGGASAGANTAKTIAVSNLNDFTNEISLSEDPTLSSTNLDKTYEIETIVDFWGGQGVTDAYFEVYNRDLFDSNDPVLYKAHGTNDFTVPFSSALELQQIYQNIGVTMKLDTLVGVGHGNFNATLNGKRLEELAFDFIVEQQGLLVE